MCVCVRMCVCVCLCMCVCVCVCLGVCARGCANVMFLGQTTATRRPNRMLMDYVRRCYSRTGRTMQAAPSPRLGKRLFTRDPFVERGRTSAIRTLNKLVCTKRCTNEKKKGSMCPQEPPSSKRGNMKRKECVPQRAKDQRERGRRVIVQKGYNNVAQAFCNKQ